MYEQMLAYLNVSQSTLEHIILAVVAVLVVGTIIVAYWQFLIAGAVACFCFVVFTHGTVSMSNNDTPGLYEKKQYIKDCYSLTDNKKMCELMWNENVDSQIADRLQEAAIERLLNNKPESE